MRLRLMLSFTFIVLVAVVSMVLIARQGVTNEVRAFMFRGTMVDVDDLVDDLADFYRVNGSWQGVEEQISNLLPSAGKGMGQPGGMGMGNMMDNMFANQRLRLADADGRLLTDSADLQFSGQLSLDDLETALPIEVDAEIVGYLLADGGMGFNSSDERLLTSRISRAAISAGLVAGGLSLLLALLLATQLMRPVRALTKAAGGLGRGDLSQRVQVSGEGELSLLGRTFNHMAASLQEAAQSRRALTADIAHELRNPLAVQRANLEALQDGVYPLTAENLAPILEQNLLLTRLVDDLRTLALADAGQLAMEWTLTDLTALTERLIERFKTQAAARQVKLEFKPGISGEPIVPVLVDPVRVEQILSNLLSNALRYAPEGGRVALEVVPSTSGVRVSVHDNGPGIPEEALALIFDRFYRADRARSRTEGGTGLGLAIARQLTEAHGGSLTAGNHPEGGAVFVMTLPLNGDSS